MPRPLHPGRPGAGSTVIPDGWAAAHAPVVARTFDCTVTIGPAGGTPTFDPDTGRTDVPTVSASYAGPASITLAGSGAVSDGTRTTVADDQIDDRTYLVKIPAGDTSTIAADHVVTVVTSPNPRLAGARLVVVSTPRPGREFSRSVIARLFD